MLSNFLTQKNQVANRPNRFRRFGGFDDGLEHKIAGAQNAFQRGQDTAVVQSLEDIIDLKSAWACSIGAASSRE